jgi:hypothetical protein
MTTIREQIEQSQVIIKELEEQSSKIGEEAYQKMISRNDLVRQLIIEESLFKGTEWEVMLYNNVPHLEFIGSRGEPPMQEISSMLKMGWHSDFEMETGISIHFDDNEVTIHFDEIKSIIPFAKQYQLVLQGQGLGARLQKLKREVAALEILCHQFGVKG